ncbi:uro-adherence factor A-like isoform X2 [Ambystoma mexicanum]|uniref:uro-adherence factor A-like isoform X2 n=1 Tax=Ambystoma mexicanum TaxID=8296 RepID=UPI0037E7250A
MSAEFKDRISPTEITRESERRRIRKAPSVFRPEELVAYWPSPDVGEEPIDSGRASPTEITREAERRRIKKDPSFIRPDEVAVALLAPQHVEKQQSDSVITSSCQDAGENVKKDPCDGHPDEKLSDSEEISIPSVTKITKIRRDSNDDLVEDKRFTSSPSFDSENQWTDNERISPTEITREAERRRVRKEKSFYRPEEIMALYSSSLDDSEHFSNSERISPTEIAREAERRRIRQYPSFFRPEEMLPYRPSLYEREQLTDSEVVTKVRRRNIRKDPTDGRTDENVCTCYSSRHGRKPLSDDEITRRNSKRYSRDGRPKGNICSYCLSPYDRSQVSDSEGISETKVRKYRKDHSHSLTEVKHFTYSPSGDDSIQWSESERISPTEITRETERRRLRKETSFFRPDKVAPIYMPSMGDIEQISDNDRMPSDIIRATARRRIRKDSSFLHHEETAPTYNSSSDFTIQVSDEEFTRNTRRRRSRRDPCHDRSDPENFAYWSCLDEVQQIARGSECMEEEEDLVSEPEEAELVLCKKDRSKRFKKNKGNLRRTVCRIKKKRYPTCVISLDIKDKKKDCKKKEEEIVITKDEACMIPEIKKPEMVLTFLEKSMMTEEEAETEKPVFVYPPKLEPVLEEQTEETIFSCFTLCSMLLDRFLNMFRRLSLRRHTNSEGNIEPTRLWPRVARRISPM